MGDDGDIRLRLVAPGEAELILAAALRTYAAAGGGPEPGNTMFAWDWRDDLGVTPPPDAEP